MIYTKSIQEKPAKKDGIRICIMRRPPEAGMYDIWMPHLSPSTKLLKDYHDKQIDWEIYEKRFNKEVLDTQKTYLEIVHAIAEKNTITLLCWEETSEMCHRRLTAERLQQLYPNAKIIIH